MRSSSHGAGFTLLEVLAAAIIMAMFYGVLSAKGVEGFALEGDADRRLRASLLADRRLADLEGLMIQGVPPELGTSEDEEDRFRVRVDVTPMELPLELLLPAPGDAEARRRAPAPSLLSAPARGQAPALRTVRITVTWNDGLAEHFIERTTFAFDPEAAAATLTEAGVALPEAPGGATP